MIKSTSLQSEYTLIYSGDPALAFPEVERLADSTDAQHDELVASERARHLRIAQQTGNWSTLVVNGQQPTLFHFRNLEQSDLGWLDGERENSTEHGRPLGSQEYLTLAVRLALRKVDGFGSNKVEHKRLGSQPKVATPDIINAIHREAGAHGADVLVEFALHIIARGNNQLDPL